MSTKETYALLISGEEQRYERAITDFQMYLLKMARFDPARVTLVLGKLGAGYVYEQTERFFKRTQQTPKANATIIYNGHGEQGGFLINGNRLSYHKWASLIPKELEFIFLNVCCYAATAIPPMKRLGLIPEQGLVIAASKKREKAYGSELLNAVLDYYWFGQPFKEQKIGKPKSERWYHALFPHWMTPQVEGVSHPVRYGKSLDHLLFADPNQTHTRPAAART